MKDIIKKILIITSAFVLVLSFSFSDWNTSKRYQVQANEYTPSTLDKAKLIAGVLAGAGIKIANDLSDLDITGLIDNLSENSKAIVNAFDYQNRMIGEYVAFQYDQLQTLTHDLILELEAWNWAEGATSYYSNGSLSNTLDLNLSLLSVQGGLSIYENPYNGQGIALITSGSSYNTLYYFPSDNYCSYSTQFGIYDSSEFFVYPTMGGMLADTLYLGVKIISSSASNCVLWWGNGGNRPAGYYPANGLIMQPYNTSTSYWTNIVSTESMYVESLALGLVGSSLTLPAPYGGWADSQAGDIDVSDFGKEIDLGTGLPLVVLGGLTAEGLQDLKNKGPQDVYLGSDAITPFDIPTVVVPGKGVGVIDDVINFPNTDSIPETNSGIAGWLGGALGALTGGLLGALNGILGWIKGIWEWLKQIAGSLSSILSLLLTLPMILFEAITGALSSLFTWDLDLTRQKFEGLRTAMMLRIPCMNETIQAWYDIIATNGHNLTSSFTFFGETFSWNSGQLLQAFAGFGALIKQAFRFVFWFVFLKGMRRRVTAFLGSMSVER